MCLDGTLMNVTIFTKVRVDPDTLLVSVHPFTRRTFKRFLFRPFLYEIQYFLILGTNLAPTLGAE